MATLEQIEKLNELKKEDEVVVQTQIKQIGEDTDGFPIFETVYVSAPKSYYLVRLIEAWNCAILKNLDYVAVADDTTAN